MKFIILFLSLLMGSFQTRAIEQEKFDRLTSLMIKGCSLGQSVQISTSGTAGISFIKKGVEGKFEAKKSEIPAIVKFLTEDEAKSNQADKTRECMIAYMNKLFDAELNSNDEKNISKESPVTVVKDGVIYDFEGCYLEGRNDLKCKFQVTSSLIDRIVSIASDKSTLFDSNSNQFIGTSAIMANKTGDKYGVRDVTLISDRSTKMAVFFKNIPSNLDLISRLRISVNSKTETSRKFKGFLEFRDVSVMRQ